jgi:hypothetical protein
MYTRWFLSGSLARGLYGTRHLVCFKGQLSCLNDGRCKTPRQYPIQEAFLRFILGRCLLTIISGILFRNKGFSDYYPQVLFSHWLREQRLIWEIILGVCWRCYLFNHFLREFIPKKEVFIFTKPICPCSPSNLYCHIIACHIKEDLTTTQGMSTSQPRCSQGSTRRPPSRWSSGELEDAFRSTWTPAVLDYEELGGLSNPGTQGCARGVLLLGYGMGHGPHPISVVATRSAIGVLVE